VGSAEERARYELQRLCECVLGAIESCRSISWLGLAMGLWLKDSRVETNANVARADLSSPMSKPYRAIPVFDLVH
jgi:hypothetical protein